MNETRLIDFVIRSDGIAKPGGDTIQVHAYAEALRLAGIDARVVPFDATLVIRRGATVHLSNIDRTFEFLAAARVARSHRVVISPIHRSHTDFLRMLRRIRVGPKMRIFNRVPVAGREWAIFVVRCVVRGRGRISRRLALAVTATAQLPTWRRHIRGELDSASQVLVIAQGEADSMTRDFGWAHDNCSIVPNGVSFEVPQTLVPWNDRPDGSIVSVGRIEPGKRSLELAEAAHEARLKVDFIGAGGLDQRYVDAFRALAACSPWITWTGSMRPAELVARLEHSRVLVNASLLEVQSLVELEAAACGCFVVSSPAGYTHEFLSSDVLTKMPDYDLPRLLQRASGRATQPSAPSIRPDISTWRDSVEGARIYF